MDAKRNGTLGAYVDTSTYQPGLTKRELFAMMVMQAWLGSFGAKDLADEKGVAEFSVKQADALLKALEE